MKLIQGDSVWVKLKSGVHIYGDVRCVTRHRDILVTVEVDQICGRGRITVRIADVTELHKGDGKSWIRQNLTRTANV